MMYKVLTLCREHTWDEISNATLFAMKLLHKLQTVLLMGLFATLLAACMPNQTDTSKQNASKKDEYSRQEHLWRQNPNPKEAFEITLKINDAPGTFNVATSGARYKSDNCSWIISDFEGVRGRPETSFRIAATKINSTEYKRIVYLDGMLNEDYYGNGVCQWYLASTGFALQATGTGADTVFAASFGGDEVRNEKSITKYYWGKAYPVHPYGAESGQSGFTEKNRMPPENTKEFFTMTISAKKVLP